jgi:hypothetical protein
MATRASMDMMRAMVCMERYELLCCYARDLTSRRDPREAAHTRGRAAAGVLARSTRRHICLQVSMCLYVPCNASKTTRPCRAASIQHAKAAAQGASGGG